MLFYSANSASRLEYHKKNILCQKRKITDVLVWIKLMSHTLFRHIPTLMKYCVEIVLEMVAFNQ